MTSEATGQTRRRRKRSRGQAMVEFALVAPVFFMLMFGLIEFSLIVMSIASYNFAAKDAARLGSLLGRTDTTVDTRMVNDIQQRSNSLVVARVTKVEVFRSDASGCCAGGSVENIYTFTGSTVNTVSVNWPVSQRNDTLLNADYLGVRISYIYTYLTSFVSGGASGLPLTAVSVQRIEPQDFQGRVHPSQPRYAGVLASETASPAGLLVPFVPWSLATFLPGGDAVLAQAAGLWEHTRHEGGQV